LDKKIQKKLEYYKNLTKKKEFLTINELHMIFLYFLWLKIHILLKNSNLFRREFYNILHNFIKKCKFYTWIDL